MAVQKSNKSCSGVQRHPRVIFSSMCRKPLPAHNEARLRLREVGVLDERAKRGKEAMDHLCKIHHLALVADRLFHPLVFISCIVDPHGAAFCCGNNGRLQVFERRGDQDCLVQVIDGRVVAFILVLGKAFPTNARYARLKSHGLQKRRLHCSLVALEPPCKGLMRLCQLGFRV
jgi:hypothetical protein